jgi:hypothetical protein
MMRWAAAAVVSASVLALLFGMAGCEGLLGVDGLVIVDGGGADASPDVAESGVADVHGDGPSTCPGGQIACAGACVDPLTSLAYCGASGDCAGPNAGAPCAAGHVCSGSAGTCVLSCPPTEVACGAVCIEPGSDLTYCGAQPGCTAFTTCQSGQTCSGGSCVLSCPPNEIACGDGCIDPTQDQTFCGAQPGCTGFTTCQSAFCSNGVCCPDGQLGCDGQCVDPQGDNTFCGASADCQGGNAGMPCPDGQSCQSGQCQ